MVLSSSPGVCNAEPGPFGISLKMPATAEEEAIMFWVVDSWRKVDFPKAFRRKSSRGCIQDFFLFRSVHKNVKRGVLGSKV